MNEQKFWTKIVKMRCLVQWLFFAWVVFIGIRFGMFVHQFEAGDTVHFISHPPGVEGFLPIGALASLKYWLLTGIFNPLHPAALVILLAIIVMSLLAKKSFCSWLCPVGTLSEAAGKAGRKLFGGNFRVWRPLDLLMRCIKYLLLIFFVKIVLIDMSLQSLDGFLRSPYWAMSDVKMLYFFTRMSAVTMVVLAILTFLTLLFEGFWCRYLCPYGALLGLVSVVSPFTIKREASRCTSCRSCSASCSARLPVHERQSIRSPECNGCLSCVSACPEREVLWMGLSFVRRPVPVWLFPAVALLVFFAGIGAGMVTGNWRSSLGVVDYQRLMLLVSFLHH
ncbi:MAG: 4Fe-4S binding protein [Geobacteraceae bacterium]